MHDMWTGWHAGIKPYWWPGIFNYSDLSPSYGDQIANTWEINPDQADIDAVRWSYDANFAGIHGMINPWHSPQDYGMAAAWHGGSVQTIAGGATYDGLEFFYIPYGPATGTELEGLLVATIRLVHLDGPAGTVHLRYDSGYGPNKDAGDAVGPAPGWVDPLLGDFDDDDDVDADGVDDLCANMGGDVGTYDMDGDGDVDEDDMVYHVENYLEFDTDSDGVADGTGTFRGDFNTDGSVNGTDLSIMNGSFGTSVGFAGGNANCDSTVNGTDLSILAGVFGNVATAAVPEPTTVSLVALGALAMLRRKRD